MKTLIFLLLFLLISISTFSQKPKSEIIERKGQVIEIAPGFTFAYSNLIFKTEDDTLYLRFPPQNGELITSHVKKGDWLELRAKVMPLRKMIGKETRFYYFLDELLAVNFDGNWVDIDNADLEKPKAEYRVFLEKRVRDEFFVNGMRSALLYENGLASYSVYNSKYHYPMKDIHIGQTVSFIGYLNEKKKGYAYPVWHLKEAYSFIRLYKAEGEVNAYLYKQNNVCIGLTLNSNGDKIKVSFPSDLAKEIMTFISKHPNVAAYYNDYKIEDQLNPPELHALVSERDSLFVTRFGFYGGADVKHNHKPAEVEGKITAINKSDKGKILSVILSNECYIEVDYNMEKQLAAYLKRGNTIKVSGQERIKKEGEIYSKDYRIITPTEITIADKAFLINQLPQ